MNPNQNARRLAEARQRQIRLQMQTLHTIVAETRDDVRRLKRALGTVLDRLSVLSVDGNQSGRQPQPGDRRDSTAQAAGGNAEQEIDDATLRHALDCEAPAPLEVYRRAYTTLGLAWPGDEHARRLYPISDDSPQAPAYPSVQQLSWQTPQRTGRPPRSRTDTQRPAPASRSGDERPASQRLADALGWDHVPQLSEAEQKESDLDLQAALVQARRLYQQTTDEFERGWDAALELAVELVAGACDGDQAQQWLRSVLHAHTGPEDELPHQQQPAPIRSVEQLVQPGMFDSERSWRSSSPSIGDLDEQLSPCPCGARVSVGDQHVHHHRDRKRAGADDVHAVGAEVVGNEQQRGVSSSTR